MRNAIVTFEAVEDKIIVIREQKVILDSDVATLYGVETRDVNKNNPDKFPAGYVMELNKKELDSLRWKYSTTNLSKTRVYPKAFTEKGLYMLATILKSSHATETTIELNLAVLKVKHTVKRMSETKE